jgi:hypothetical protein
MPSRAPDDGQQLVILADGDGPTTHRAMGAIEARGAQVLQRYGDRVLICAAPPKSAEAIDALKSVKAVHAAPVPRAPRGATAAEELGIEAWNLRRSKGFAAAKAERPREGVAWDQTGATPDAPDGPGMTHVTEGGTAEARGFIGSDLSPYLIGSVAVGLIIVDGPTPDLQFSDAEKTKVVAEVQEGLGWLAQQEPRASVSFSYDIRNVQIANPPDPNKSGYELLEAHWRDPALISLGHMGNILGAKQHAEKIRSDLATRWAYVAFFTKYPVAHFAYAMKPKLIMQYDNDGWGPDNIDRVFTHETGHIFGCPDEYASSNCSCSAKFGWWREPNSNCQNCANPQIACLMSANTWAMCPQTPKHLGWRDSNNDGILDDTSDAGLFDYRKFCSAVPLVCQLIGLSPEPLPPAPPGVAAGVAGPVSGGGGTGVGSNWPGGGVPMLLLERTLGAEEIARVEAAVRAEELGYLVQVEKRLRAALRQVREYRAALEPDESP